MIIDKLSNHKLYESCHPLFKKAFDFLINSDLNKLPLGKIEIDGDKLFALVNEYNTEYEEEGILEAHKKYIDLQYIVSGAEKIGYLPLTNQIPSKQYVEEDDYALYDEESDLIIFRENMFCILFPDDLHMPGVHSDKVEQVRKIVLKIKMEDSAIQKSKHSFDQLSMN